MDKLIEQIKSLWPNIQVTKEIIQKPTPEFVMQFYSHFIAAVEERIRFTLGWCQDNLRTDLDPEEVIYLKMTKINDIFQSIHLNFMLADIYDPHPIRTKNLIKVCFHILRCIESFSVDVEKINTNIFEMKDSMSTLASAKDQLLIEINEAAMLKGQLIEDIEKVKKEKTEAEEQKEEYLLKRPNLEITFQELKKELESSKRNVDECKRSIANLEETEKQLLKESITDEEYIALKETIANLEIEKESLINEEVNMEDLLSDQNRLFEHFRSCIKALPDNFNTDLVNKEKSMERELQDMEREINNLWSQLSSLKTTHAHQKKIFTNSKNAFEKSNLEYANLKEKIKEQFEKISKDVLNKNEKLLITLKQCLSENKNYKMDIFKLENSLEQFREHVTKEYIKIAKVENKVFQKL
ncbi:unnamed protein product [Psylliodes chrysocephalus]|uniref:Kinetochore protein Nuf2 n=1 Tax=Psylliodes chrysocephalus TaxID=3402493 RepID=A0A9P0GKA0_9CUCU|nr:unnamed protein product [Psylliodes chrysocephala]